MYAYSSDSEHHAPCHAWLHAQLSGTERFAVSDLVLSAFLRIITNPRIFNPPGNFDRALGFANALRAAPRAVAVTPGPRHWEIFLELCASAHARGNLVAHAYLAALAIESGCEWVTTDGDFARFPGLRWRRPF